MQIPVQIYNEHGQTLGILSVPPQRAKGNPVVQINYGLNGHRVDNHRLAVEFTEKALQLGITVMRFDYLGCGVSSNEFWETSIASKTRDSREVINFLKGCFGEEPFKLILLGYSDGIRVIHYLLQSENTIHAFVAWNPIIKSMTSTFKSTQKKKFSIEPKTKKLVFPLFGVYMGVDYLKEVNQDIPIVDLLSHSIPKLFAFGSGDKHTISLQTELSELENGHSDFDLITIENANHIFNRKAWSETLINKTLGWIQEVCSLNNEKEYERNS